VQGALRGRGAQVVVLQAGQGAASCAGGARASRDPSGVVLWVILVLLMGWFFGFVRLFSKCCKMQ
jgi:hypothetical protein